MIETKPAATVAVVRDTAEGMEALLLERNHTAVFMPGRFVFPGGAVDRADTDTTVVQRAVDTDDTVASAMLGITQGGLSYFIAAIRECFEEAGLLLADSTTGAMKTDELASLRDALTTGRTTWAALCQSLALRLHTHRMGYLSHWVTPPGPPRRYDTRFFVVPAPAGQHARHDGQETVSHRWVTPRRALDEHAAGALPLGAPTRQTLRTLSAFDTVPSLIRQTRECDPRNNRPRQ